MADEQTRGGEGTRSLVQRLEERIARLEQLDVSGGAREELDAAIAALRKDTETLKIMAPHLFAFVPEE